MGSTDEQSGLHTAVYDHAYESKEGAGESPELENGLFDQRAGKQSDRKVMPPPLSPNMDGNIHSTLQPDKTPSRPTASNKPSEQHISFQTTNNTPSRRSTPPSRTPSVLSFLKNSFSSSSGNVHHHKRSDSPSPPPKPRGTFPFSFSKRSSRSTSTTVSPEVLGMSKNVDPLDLEDVNARLQNATLLSRENREAKDLEFHQREVQKCKKLLTEAMEARSRGDLEICRGKCYQIIDTYFAADVESVIYAYNILSTQASPGQAKHFLDESKKLVRKHVRDKPELEKLEGVIRVLRECADKRDKELREEEEERAGRNADKKRKGKQNQVDVSESESRMKVDDNGLKPNLKLELPDPSLQPVKPESRTPKTEKILSWGSQGS